MKQIKYNDLDFDYSLSLHSFQIVYVRIHELCSEIMILYECHKGVLGDTCLLKKMKKNKQSFRRVLKAKIDFQINASKFEYHSS